jgi:hypothetical protein
MEVLLIKRIKKVLSTNLITRVPYKILVYIKYFITDYPRKRKKRKQIQSKGAETIKKLHEVLRDCNCIFHVDMGTLLGIIREGKLLGHDLDIDIAVHTANVDKINEIKKRLLNNNCIHKYRYKIEGIGIVEDSFILNNIKFDINYYLNIEGKSLCYLFYREDGKKYDDNKFNAVRLSCSEIERVTKIPFMGFDVNVPIDSEKYLSERYGQNWRIPDKSYVYWKGPSAEKVNYIGERIEY